MGGEQNMALTRRPVGHFADVVVVGITISTESSTFCDSHVSVELTISTGVA